MRYDYPEKSIVGHRGYIMKIHFLNKYSYAGIMFIGAAAVFIAIVLFASTGEFTRAALVLSGLVCAMTGIFAITFSQDEPFNLPFVRLLPVEGCVNLCRIMSELGVSGNAHFLPPRLTGESMVIQFNPTGVYNGIPKNLTDSFSTTSPTGIISRPSCSPLINDLKKRNIIILPDTEDTISQLLDELFAAVYTIASKVSIQGNGNSWEGNQVSLRIHHYRLIEGCRVIAEESPGCCTKNPCPACSLCGALIAEVSGKVVTLQECSIDANSRDIRAVFIILPTVTGSGNP
jgi:hypothetical protein